MEPSWTLVGTRPNLPRPATRCLSWHSKNILFPRPDWLGNFSAGREPESWETSPAISLLSSCRPDVSPPCSCLQRVARCHLYPLRPNLHMLHQQDSKPQSQLWKQWKSSLEAVAGKNRITRTLRLSRTLCIHRHTWILLAGARLRLNLFRRLSLPSGGFTACGR